MKTPPSGVDGAARGRLLHLFYVPGPTAVAHFALSRPQPLTTTLWDSNPLFHNSPRIGGRICSNRVSNLIDHSELHVVATWWQDLLTRSARLTRSPVVPRLRRLYSHVSSRAEYYLYPQRLFSSWAFSCSRRLPRLGRVF